VRCDSLQEADAAPGTADVSRLCCTATQSGVLSGFAIVVFAQAILGNALKQFCQQQQQQQKLTGSEDFCYSINIIEWVKTEGGNLKTE
jgi:hypothetical protein